MTGGLSPCHIFYDRGSVLVSAFCQLDSFHLRMVK